MPRLGDDSPVANHPYDEMRPLTRRQAAVAYQAGGNSIKLSTFCAILLFVALFWVVPNVFFTDYRKEALESLRSSGKTEEEIERWLPSSIQEKRKTQVKNFEGLKEEVDELKKRLEILEAHVNQSAQNNG